MESVASVGKGYYNYYHLSNRYETKSGKAETAWYDLDLSAEEIKGNNNILNREYEGADILRKVAERFAGIAASNRNRYRSADEMQSAVWAKYSLGDAYKGLSKQEKSALARTEINMTLFGTVSGDALIVAGIDGDVTKNTLGRSEKENRTFNINMLGKQIGNVFNHNGLNISLFGNRAFRFSVNGMTNKLSVMMLDDEAGMDKSVLDEITKALNSKDNAKHLFYNLLADSNKQGLIPSEQLAKWRLFSEFRNITGFDIRAFKQTKEGFVNEDGHLARDIYKEHLKHSSKVSGEFKATAYDYFVKLEADAARYDISKVPDLTLSLEYQNGYVKLPGEQETFDRSI